MDKNNISINSIKSQKTPKVYILTSKPNSNSTLSTIWESITGLFKSDDIIEPKDTIRTQLCKCPKTKNNNYCDNIYELFQMIKNNDEKRCKELYLDLLKINDKSLDINEENICQIKKDTTRTYPSTLTSNQKGIIFKKLENVLRAFSNYNNTIKYCQGMNFIVGFFLYHCEEHIAFWLFVSLIEEYDLINLFMENFPGFKIHVHRVEAILKNVKDKIKYFYNIFRIFKYIKLRLGLYFFLELIFILVMTYYLFIFCTVYHQSQISITINYIVGALTSLAISAGLTVIITILRIISLNYRSKKLYNISRFIYDKF